MRDEPLGGQAPVAAQSPARRPFSWPPGWCWWWARSPPRCSRASPKPSPPSSGPTRPGWDRSTATATATGRSRSRRGPTDPLRGHRLRRLPGGVAQGARPRRPVGRRPLALPGDRRPSSGSSDSRFLLLFLGGVAAAVVRLYRLDRRAAAGPAAGLAAWAVHAGLDWDWEMPAVTLPALLLAAAAIAWSERCRPPAGGQGDLLGIFGCARGRRCSHSLLSLAAGGARLRHSPRAPVTTSTSTPSRTRRGRTRAEAATPDRRAADRRATPRRSSPPSLEVAPEPAPVARRRDDRPLGEHRGADASGHRSPRSWGSPWRAPSSWPAG